MEPKQPLQPASETTVGRCEFDSRLGAFHDGELDADAERLIERHLATCEACRSALQEIRELSMLAGHIGVDGISSKAVRRIHQAIDGEDRHHSIFRIAGVLTGLAASVMVVGTAWLWDVADSGSHVGHKVVIIDPGPSQTWEYLAVNLKSDPLPTSRWEINDRQMLADARLTNWMLEGLSGSNR